MYIGLHIKITRYFYQILMKLEFSGHIFENTQILNFMKIRLVGAELFLSDGQTERQADGQRGR